MQELWTIYHPEIPEFLQELAATPPMERLKRVGMNCGCEYTGFPLFAGVRPYSRFDHSMGVALIIWHFTGSVKQAVAGLFHDVTTPVFAHVVDFLNGDHLRQESTEAGVRECLASSPQVMALLERYGLVLEEVCDYHQYPVADNDSPALSADRLEYTLGNLLNYGFASLEQVHGFYEDLTVGQNEHGETELVFRTAEQAAAFTKAALKTSHIYVADEDRFAMQALADLLDMALKRRGLCYADLWTTEQEVLQKLRADRICKEAWERFCGLTSILRTDRRPEKGYWVCVGAKKRWIDPVCPGKGRVSQWDAEARRMIADFQVLDFSCWLSGK